MDKLKEQNEVKEIHIWMGNNYPINEFCGTLGEALTAINYKKPIIHTGQTLICTTYNMSAGYRMFVHMLDGETVEIKFGYNEKIKTEIRLDTNLERLLLRNGFGLAVTGHNLMPI